MIRAHQQPPTSPTSLSAAQDRNNGVINEKTCVIDCGKQSYGFSLTHMSVVLDCVYHVLE